MKFRPYPLLRDGLVQTLSAHLLGRPSVPSHYETAFVPLDDGDQLVLHIDHAARAESPIVLFFHGLGGCSESRYILRIADKLVSRGMTCVRFNHRAALPGIPYARQIYHAGRTDDLLATIRFLHRRWPGRPLAVVGFSLSANMLLLLLGRDSKKLDDLKDVAGAMAICPPVNLTACADALSERRNWILDQYYTRLLRHVVAVRAQTHELDPPPFPRRMNLRTFDELFTAPEGGFASVQDYYRLCSSTDYLQDIQLPTRIIAADDDPIIPVHYVRDATKSDSVELIMTRGGGHMGFLHARSTPAGDRRWMDWAVLTWLVGLGFFKE